MSLSMPAPPAPPPHRQAQARRLRLAAALVVALAVALLATVGSTLWARWLAPPWGEVQGRVDPACDLHHSPCRAVFPDGSTLTLRLAPLPVAAGQPMAVQVDLSGAPARAVSLDLDGETMNMGPNHSELLAQADGRWTGSADLSVCVSGRMGWAATLRAKVGGATLIGRFRFDAGG